MIFTFCLIFTSIIKNNTRSIEKKISKLNYEIKELNLLHNEVKLEHEYLTTPNKLITLYTKYLDDSLSHYNKADIKNLNLTTLNKKKN